MATQPANETEIIRSHSLSQATLRRMSKGVLRRPEPIIRNTHLFAVSKGGSRPRIIGQVPVSQTVEPVVEISGESDLPKESSLAPEIFMGREVIRCRHCHLNQFLTGNGMCRKCRHSLAPAPEPIIDVQPVAKVTSAARVNGIVFDFPFAVKLVRTANLLSQRDLAKLMAVPRTFISKIENGKCLPSVRTVLKLAEAMQCEPFRLIQIAEIAA